MSRDRPLFADGFPLMLLSQASLASLNTRLGAGGSELVVEETRFRPNILVSGDFEGFQEDRSVQYTAWIIARESENEHEQVGACQTVLVSL